MNPLLLLLGIGAVGFVLASKKTTATGSGAPAPGKGPVPAPAPAPKYDKNLPAILEATVDQELATDNNPASLTQFADSLLPDYPIAAGVLNAKAHALSAGVVPPPPPVNPLPAPPVQPPPPAPVVIAQPAPAPPPGTPPAPPPPALPPVVTIPPITIIGTPTTGDGSGDGSGGGTSDGGGSSGSYGGPAPWDPSWGTPDVSGVSIPGNYTPQSQETTDIQNGVNAFALQTGYSGPEIPLTVDGMYGPNTQAGVAAVQTWANNSLGAGLTVDGLAGPLTQPYVEPFTPNGSIANDGGY